ncbi:MAG: thioesterase family protein [Syntrophorhabdaceae bacterium]|nr:thioesterase family protein [Syntrophorhabdaceae bacterium]
MARIILKERPEYRYRFKTRVQVRDINYAGHLGNDAIISIIGNARAELFHSFGFYETDLGDGETGIIITDLAISYKGEAFLFDELLIETSIGEITERSFRLYHRVKKDEKTIAIAETGQVCFNYKKREVSLIPEKFLEWLKKGSSPGLFENTKEIG